MDGTALRPLHLGISVESIEASVRWYGEMLGFTLLSDAEMPALESRVAFLGNGSFQLELFQHRRTLPLPPGRRTPNDDIRTQGTKHICFAHEDVPGLLAELRRKGADVVMEQVVKGKPMGFVRDNTGILIEFIQCQTPAAETGGLTASHPPLPTAARQTESSVFR